MSYDVTTEVPAIRQPEVAVRLGRHGWQTIADKMADASVIAGRRSKRALMASGSSAARLPVYYGRIVRHAPRGSYRFMCGTWRWFSDADGRKALRTKGLEGEESFVRARQQHRDEIKFRAIMSTVGGVAVGLPGWQQWNELSSSYHEPTLAGLAVAGLLGLGLLGKPEDAKVLDERRTSGKRRLKADDIIRGIEALRITQIRQAVREDERNSVRATVGYDERKGITRAIVTLIGGATANDVMTNHGRFCSIIQRDESQVLMTPGKRADQVIIEISDKAAGERKPEVSPVLKADKLDVTRPIVIGADAMGRYVSFTLDQALIIIGRSGSGKTVTTQDVVASVLLDPTVDLWLWDGKGGGDFSHFAPAARVSIIGDGAEDEYMRTQGLSMLKELSREAGKRSAILRDLGAASVTPELAQMVPGLQPIVAVFDEFQFLMADRQAKQIITELVRRIRSTNIRLIVGGQNLDGKTIEYKFAGLFRKRIAMQLSDGSENTYMLGNSSVSQGFDAVAIERTGEGILAGEDGLRRFQAFNLTEDQQKVIVQRALALRGGVVEKLNLEKYDIELKVESESLRSNFEGENLDQSAETQVELEPEKAQLICDVIEAFGSEPKAHIEWLVRQLNSKHQGISYSEIKDAITGATDIGQRDVSARYGIDTVCGFKDCDKQGTHSHTAKGYHMNEIEPILKQKGII